MLYIDRKYTLLVSARLEQFKEKGPDLYNFRCPFCGDSRKNKFKARGYIFKALKYDGYTYKCWNCDVSTNMYGFLEYLDPLILKDYVMESFQANGTKYRCSMPATLAEELKLDERDPIALCDIKLPSIDQLPSDHFARMYIEARLIPLKNQEDVFFAEDFKKFMDETFPWHGKLLKDDDPRVVMFYTDMAGFVSCVCGRSFQADPKLRYIKIKVSDYRKIYGLNRLTSLKEKIYMTEGEFDSMFLPNAIASGDSNLAGAAEWMRDTFGVSPVLVFDREPRSRELGKIIERAIDDGWDVALLPDIFPGKDINEAHISGMSIKEIQSIIDNNTFNGLEAKLRFSSWKK